ncbi:hypothetical protein AB835_06205 [Candidatus Endobugula sertula]|uniref:Aminotransferase n=1 Tax=Candidatus Endobugula sertula TaxID=62101 RepID=A0A1D2QQU4_9GAMM|nr:hypothetical protein AB835_06205 [Candidatus Endobugula sertula]
MRFKNKHFKSYGRKYQGLKHGGNVGEAAKTYGQPEAGWLDLSTGISPWMYPIPDIPQQLWRTLPYQNEHFWRVIAEYYQVTPEIITAVAGSQGAIRQMPYLLEPESVAIPAIGYKEHQYSWERAGHRVCLYQSWGELENLLDQGEVTHCVVINPNNPSAEYVDNTVIEAIYRSVSGYLIIDEAFMDVDERCSFIPYLPKSMVANNRLIILRSVGKFFGLAGIRLGFALGCGELIESLRAAVYPWAVNSPALYIAECALSDVAWQQKQRLRIRDQESQLLTLLTSKLPRSCHIVSAGLFVSIFGPSDTLMPIYQQAVRHAILLREDRLLDQCMWLRVGLPGEQYNRLANFIEAL